jgi:hypothetical protein
VLINKKAVKEVAKTYGKQVSKEYLEQLDYRVNNMIVKSCSNARQFKRLTAGELLTIGG